MTIIIVCDDEAAARRGAIRALGSTDYRFVECDNGLQCLQALQTGPVDLVLLDLRMPVMDGGTALERIIASPDAWVLDSLEDEQEESVPSLVPGAATQQA